MQEAEEIIQNLIKDLYKEAVAPSLKKPSYKKIYRIVEIIKREIENNGLQLG